MNADLATDPSNHIKKQWLVLLPAMTLPLVASLFYFVLYSDRAFSQWIYTGTKVFTLIWPVLAVWLVLRRPLPRIRWRTPAHRKALPLGLGVGAAIVGVMFVLLNTPVGVVVEGSADKIREKASGLGFLEHYWAFAVFLSVFHSLLEEYYWRWFVFGELATVTRPAVAHGLAAVAFMAHHLVIATQFFPLGWGLALGSFVGVGGLIFSWLYQRQGTLVGAWIAHLLVDVGLMVIGHQLIFGRWF